MNPKLVVVLFVIGIIGGVAGAFLFQSMNQNGSIAYQKLVSVPLTEISSYQLLPKIYNNDTDFVLIDVRDRASCELGHIKGAICDPFPNELQNNYNTLPKNKTIIVYCWSSECMLGPTASAFLATKGIYDMELRIGWCEWSERGYPIEGERYILSDECLQPQRSINNETVYIINSSNQSRLKTGCSGNGTSC